MFRSTAPPDTTNPLMCFVNGPGGTGKTYLQETLLHHVRSTGDIGIVSAPSGVAASLLTGGLTNHSMFKIPVRDDDDEMPDINLHRSEAVATLLKSPRLKLIILDEAGNVHSSDMDAINRVLQEMRGNRKPFGGLVVVFSGDFRQILPVIRADSDASQLDACIFSCDFWPQVREIEGGDTHTSITISIPNTRCRHSP
jgi:hypothetical protein